MHMSVFTSGLVVISQPLLNLDHYSHLREEFLSPGMLYLNLSCHTHIFKMNFTVSFFPAHDLSLMLCVIIVCTRMWGPCNYSVPNFLSTSISDFSVLLGNVFSVPLMCDTFLTEKLCTSLELLSFPASHILAF